MFKQHIQPYECYSDNDHVTNFWFREQQHILGREKKKQISTIMRAIPSHSP